MQSMNLIVNNMTVPSTTFEDVKSSNGELQILQKYITDHLSESDHDQSIAFNRIAELADLKCIKLAHTSGLHWNQFLIDIVIRYGNLDCLKYVYENLSNFNSFTSYYAIKYNKFDCLKYLVANGCQLNNMTKELAAENGNLECLKYAHENGCSWTDKTACLATKNGHLECLKYAHENGCSWDEKTPAYATSYGQINCLKYAHENGCPWDEETTNYAASNGHLDCLMYAHENGCPWDYTLIKSAKYRQDITTDLDLIDQYQQIINYALQNGCPFEQSNEQIDEQLDDQFDVYDYQDMFVEQTIENLELHVSETYTPDVFSECPICAKSDPFITDFSDDQPIQTFPITIHNCDHSFHFHCLNKWFISSKKRSCPCCRSILPSDDEDFFIWRLFVN